MSKIHGLHTKDEDFKLLKNYFGKIQIKTEHTGDCLLVYSEFMKEYIYYTCNVHALAESLRNGSKPEKI